MAKESRDIAELVKEYLSEDRINWGKLASNIQWRRLQLLLLREILLELRKLNRGDNL
jgi:hypothetical protein